MCVYYTYTFYTCIDPIIKQPAHKQIKYCTSDATLSVSVDPKLTDPDTTSYQWIRYKQARSIDPVKDDDHFNGADSEELTVRNLTKEHAGVYCCVVTVSGVPIHSRKATLKVKGKFFIHLYLRALSSTVIFIYTYMDCRFVCQATKFW